MDKEDTSTAVTQVEETTAPAATTITSGDSGFRAKLKTLWGKKYVPIAVILAAVVIVTSIASVSYALYQQPSNVLGSALKNAFNAQHAGVKGTIDTTKGSAPTTISFDAVAANQEFSTNLTIKSNKTGAVWQLNGDIVYDKSSTLYLRLNGLEDLLKQFETANPMVEAYAPIAKGLSGKWIKVTSDTLNQMTASSGDNLLTCVQNFQKATSTNDQRAKIADLYQKYQFISIAKTLPDQSIDGHDSFHYQLTSDKAKAKQFMTELDKIDSFKKLADCSKGQITFEGSDAKTVNSDFEVWVDKWSHNFTKVHSVSKSTEDGSVATLDATIDYAKDVKVTVPSGAEDFQQLIREIFQQQSAN